MDYLANRMRTKTAIVIYLFITGVLLLPNIMNAWSKLPDIGDSYHNIWIMGDNLNRVFSDRAIFSANIFYPAEDSVAFQEMQWNNTVVFGIFYGLSGNPVFAYNVLLFLTFFLTGLSSFVSARVIGCRFLISLFVGLFTAYYPARFVHTPHVQLLAFFWVIIPFGLLIAYLRSARRELLVLFGVTYYFQSLNIGYCTAFLIFLCWSYVLYRIIISRFIGRQIAPWRSLVNVVLVFVGSFLASLPFYLPYLHAASNGLKRGFTEWRQFGLDLLQLSAVPKENIFYGEHVGAFRDFRIDGNISASFPGFIFLVIFGFALAVFIFRVFRDQNFLLYRDCGYFLFMGLFFLGIAFGPIIKLRGEDLMLSPLIYFFKYFPLLQTTRYLPAYVQPTVYCFSIFSAIVLSTTTVVSTSSVKRCLCIILLFCIGTLESATFMPLSQVVSNGTSIPSVYKWLRQKKSRPIVELPILNPKDTTPSTMLLQYQYMYYSVFHHHILVNGISGFTPRVTVMLQGLLADFPSGLAVEKLQNLDVGYIVLHYNRGVTFPDPEKVTSLDTRLSLVYRDKDTAVFRIRRRS